MKKCHFTLAIGREIETTRPLSEDLFESITGYQMSAKYWRSDGIFERMHFDNMQPVEIDLDGEWKFTLQETKQMRHKLLNM